MKRLARSVLVAMWALALPLALPLFWARVAFANEIPAAQQSLLFLRVLAYDRNLKSRATDLLTVAVVHRADHPEEAVDMVGALGAIAAKARVAGLALKVVALPYSDAASFGGKLAAAHISAIYLCNGVTDVAGVIDATRKHAALSATGREAAVRSGVSVGFVERDAHPALLINVPSSRAEGADLDAAVLRLAEVIR